MQSVRFFSVDHDFMINPTTNSCCTCSGDTRDTIQQTRKLKKKEKEKEKKGKALTKLTGTNIT